jgi:phosphohistidine phosphatase
MTQLCFLRHADAGDPEAWTRPDAERPLSDKGKRQADRLARFLESTAFRPDAILSSPKIRAEQTAGRWPSTSASSSRSSRGSGPRSTSHARGDPA